MHLASRVNVVQAGKHPVPTASAVFSASQAVFLGRVGEAGADSQRGRKVALYKFAKKEAGLPREQKSDTRRATEAVQPLPSSGCGLGSGV